jgi:hypothetical protein
MVELMRKSILLQSWSLASVVTMLCVAASASAQPSDKPPKQKHDQQTISLDFKNTPWRDVFKSLAQQAGMPFASSNRAPPSTFTFASPPGRKHTMLEAIDTINDHLEKENWLLIRHGGAILKLIPADEAFLGSSPLQVEINELAGLEMHLRVWVEIDHKGRNVEEYGDEIKKRLGPNARIHVYPEGGQGIWVIDEVRNLRTLLASLSEKAVAPPAPLCYEQSARVGLLGRLRCRFFGVR